MLMPRDVPIDESQFNPACAGESASVSPGRFLRDWLYLAIASISIAPAVLLVGTGLIQAATGINLLDAILPARAQQLLFSPGMLLGGLCSALLACLARLTSIQWHSSTGVLSASLHVRHRWPWLAVCAFGLALLVAIACYAVAENLLIARR